MPKARKPKAIEYEVGVARTLTLTTLIAVTATTEEAARKQAKKLAYADALTWYTAGELDWQEEEDEVTIDTIDEA